MYTPKKLKLMVDYDCWCLWDMENPDNIDPDTLPLSEELKNKMEYWTEMFDITLNRSDPSESGFKNEKELQDFVKFGYEIFEMIKLEIPQSKFYYYDRINNSLEE